MTASGPIKVAAHERQDLRVAMRRIVVVCAALALAVATATVTTAATTKQPAQPQLTVAGLADRKSVV